MVSSDVENMSESDEEELTDDENEGNLARAHVHEGSETDDENGDGVQESEIDEEDVDDDVELDDYDEEEDDDERDDEEEEVLTAVVVHDDDDDVDSDDDSTVAVVEAEAVFEPEQTSKKKFKKSSNSQKLASDKSGIRVISINKSNKNDEGKSSMKCDTSDQKSTKTKSNNTSKPLKESDAIKKKSRSSTVQVDVPTIDPYQNVPPALTEAANDARSMLRESIRVLPFPVAETQVRSLGRLCVQVDSGGSDSKSKKSADVRNFCTSSALYPIGFSCDRYEFSPVHGRVLKMRCSILEGRSIKARQKELLKVTKSDDSTSSTPPIKITEIANIHNGPIFRITWGRGLDEEPEKNTEYPYDPDVNSKPLFVNSRGKPVSEIKNVGGREKVIKPEKGMQVRVRFENDQFHTGHITKVTKSVDNTNVNKNTGKSTRNVTVTVKFDYGAKETFLYPDPDLVVVMPGEKIGTLLTTKIILVSSLHSRSFLLHRNLINRLGR
jgi:hypothetical protein